MLLCAAREVSTTVAYDPPSPRVINYCCLQSMLLAWAVTAGAMLLPTWGARGRVREQGIPGDLDTPIARPMANAFDVVWILVFFCF
jgi:hypothetical protein